MENRQPTPEEVEDLRNIALSYGVPVARRVFRQIVKNTELRPQDKVKLHKKIDEIHPEIVNPGSLTFKDSLNKIWYVILDDCGRDQDLNQEFEKISLDEKQMAVLKRQMSIMFNYARFVYAEIAHEQQELMDLLRHALEYAIDIDQLQYDLEKTQLYICKDWIDRIGFQIKPPPPSVAENPN
jgi:hypothetical protein